MTQITILYGKIVALNFFVSCQIKNHIIILNSIALVLVWQLSVIVGLTISFLSIGNKWAV